MIISDKDATSRLNSPLNLINRLRQNKPRNGSAMGIFTGNNGKSSAVTSQLTSAEAETQTVPESHPTSSQVDIPEAKAKPWFNPFTTSSDNLPAIIPATPASPTAEEPSPTLESILEDSESNIKLALAHNSAVELLSNSIELLSAKLDNVKADKLSGVITAATKTIESIRKERSEAAKTNKGKEVHYHFYTPIQKKLEDYGPILEVEGIVEPGTENHA